MHRHFASAALLLAGFSVSCRQTAVPTSPPTATGRRLPTTFPSAVTLLGNFPCAMVSTPDHRLAVTTDLGGRESLTVLRTRDAKALSHVDYNPRAGASGADRSVSLYYGLALEPAGAGYTLYASQGAHDSIAVLHLDPTSGTLSPSATIKTKANDFPSGLAVDGHGHLVVANNYPATWQTNNPGWASVAVYDTATKKELGRYTFEDGRPFPTSTYPLAVACMPDGRKFYVSSQRDACVYAFDSTDPASLKLAATIPTGSHPAALLLDRGASNLYVANASSDTISVIDTAGDRVAETILLRPEIARGLAGCSPMGLALSPDGKTLYAALADLNAVGVIDTATHALRGYAPAGWYPTGVAPTPDGKRLLVANARGVSPRNPNPAPGAANPAKRVSPIWLIDGAAVTIDAPGGRELPKLTEQALSLARLTPRDFPKGNPLKEVRVRHVLYVIKENRTYDCVLGDVKAGNGDPRRCLFPRPVTPNQHALAERFVLFDNFYDCGEVSGDGWVWSTQGMANEYVTKNVTYNYAHRGRVFDFEGTNSGYPTGGLPAVGPDGVPLSEDPKLKNGLPAIPDVSEAPGGHIWDACARAGVSFRNYGFFTPVDDIRTKDGHLVLPGNYPAAAGLIPGGHDLAGRTDVDFRKFDLDYADSDAPDIYYRQTGDKAFLRRRTEYGKYDSRSRFAEWNREFRMMLAKDPSGGAVPAVMFMRFPTDHTQAMSSGKPTPSSMVADNDYAVGQIVEAVSHSPIWKDTAIFIIEDDAQDGPDHVDSHRSTCYVVSPWIKRNQVDHTFLNTDSVLHTMELLLGLPPMCQLDATAPVIADWDSAPRNAEPYGAVLPAPEILRQRNGVNNPSVPRREISPEAALNRESDGLDFTEADRVPAGQMTALVWKSVRGAASEPPPTPKGPTPLHPRGHDDDDD